MDALTWTLISVAGGAFTGFLTHVLIWLFETRRFRRWTKEQQDRDMELRAKTYIPPEAEDWLDDVKDGVDPQDVREGRVGLDGVNRIK